MSDPGIRKRKGKHGVSYEVHVYAGRDPLTHKDLRLTGTRRTLQEARALKRELAKSVADGTATVVSGSHKTVGALLDRYLERGALDWSANTVREQQRIVDSYLRPHLGDFKLIDLVRHPELIEDTYTRLRRQGGAKGEDGKRKPLSDATVARAHRVLHAALEQAVRLRWITRNPAGDADAPAEPKHDPTAPAVADIDKVMVAVRAADDPTLHAFAALAVNTGMRAGELCAVRWGSVDLDAAELTVKESVARARPGETGIKGLKQGGRGRKIALGPLTVEALRALRTDRAAEGIQWVSGDAFVFVRRDRKQNALNMPERPDTASRRWRKFQTDRNLPDVTLRDLRHHVATQILEGGYSVKEGQHRLGHALGSTFTDRYAAKLPATDHAAARAIER